MAFLTLEQLYETRDVSWIIEDVLPANAVSAVYGDTQTGKSYLMVDWACCVLTGTPWMGRQVKQGPVLYIASEDLDDFTRRFQGWELEHSALTGTPIHFTDESVQLLSEPSVQALIDDLTKLEEPPVLIIIDTYGKSIVDGMRSNDGDKDRNEINRTIRNADRIRKAAAPDAALVLVSHTTKDGNLEAGSAAFRQGVRMLAHLSGTAEAGAVVTLTCRKLKGRKFEAIALRCEEVDASDTTTSLVFKHQADRATGSASRACRGAPPKGRARRQQKVNIRQQVLDLHEQGEKAVHIAAKLHVPSGTVRSIISRSQRTRSNPHAA